MKIFDSIQDFKSPAKTVVTLGTFDGVHIGHRKIIERLLQNASECGCETLLLTFFPHPRMVLQDASEIKLLNTLSEKAMLLEKAGLQNLVVHAFDKAFSRLTAEEFVREVLVEQFHIQKIIIGYDHRFGRNRTADITDLIRFGESYGFEVEQISPQEVNEVAVSSTKIRKALLEGDIELANRYLGYAYLLSGTVVKGRELGRTIGYPTANLQIAESYKLIPQQGVYVVRGEIDGQTVYGMMNIGTNPTVGGQSESIEVHFFDLDQDLYGKTISVSLLRRLRAEQKFDSVTELVQQLGRDKVASLAFLSGNK